MPKAHFVIIEATCFVSRSYQLPAHRRIIETTPWCRERKARGSEGESRGVSDAPLTLKHPLAGR